MSAPYDEPLAGEDPDATEDEGGVMPPGEEDDGPDDVNPDGDHDGHADPDPEAA